MIIQLNLWPRSRENLFIRPSEPTSQPVQGTLRIKRNRVVVEGQIVSPRQAPMRTAGVGWGKSAMGSSACLLSHGGTCGGTSDAVVFEAEKNHLLA